MPDKQVRMIVRPSVVTLGGSTEIRRIPPRAPEKRQPEYELKFDDETLFFDIFNSERGVELVGPPLLNLRKYLVDGQVLLEPSQVADAVFADIDRTQDSYVKCDMTAQSVRFENMLIDDSFPVGESYTHLFENKYTLVTLSKNNSLNWVKEWVSFHVINHGVNSVLFYDNDSTDYRPEDIVEALTDIPDLDVVVVVHWPYKYGPQGGTWEGSVPAPWDSDFCQHGAINHARRRFLSNAAGVINADIDELVVLDDGGNVFEKLANSGAAALSYTGRWIEAIREQTSSIPSFEDFRYFDKRSQPCTRKWTASPLRMADAVQWCTHEIRGADLLEVSDIAHRHFKGINSDWKYPRTTPPTFDDQFHNVDVILQGYLGNAYATSPQRLLAPPAAEMTRSVGVSTTLQQIEASFLTESDQLGFVVKTWYWRPSCLVFELNYFGLRIGIDLTNSDTGFQMKMIGRDDHSKALLTNSLKTDASNKQSSSGHWKVRTWPRTVSGSTIAHDIKNMLLAGQS
ncbi:hypothetical protein CQ018_12195 [Arthrobacter sp. MYb227]|uniref:hypothetical protein n=1 Tax=Arthrobacter sp. MYb227 TaxID=1848601 RepID=UPI000CFAF82F|nr:hypothetical protein [Arthrobacter sp. MYb227]PQZ92258.1 hypothetical protein CQ018_12195 [Arthrobacter sp. MYb227]